MCSWWCKRYPITRIRPRKDKCHSVLPWWTQNEADQTDLPQGPQNDNQLGNVPRKSVLCNANAMRHSGSHEEGRSMTFQVEELLSPAHFRDTAPQLTEEQLKLSTAELYEAKTLNADKAKNDKANFTGKYAHLRPLLDYSYHKVPTKPRQLMQDTLVDYFASLRIDECKACEEVGSKPIVLFTGGAMASGKGHTLRHYLKEGKVSLPADCVWVDPDKIARQLPERQQYLDNDPASMPSKLHPEASLVQEVLGRFARESRRSIVVDGSLSNGEWYKKIMKQFKDDGYKIEIFFVFADIPIMEKRAKARQKSTGRQTDIQHIRRTAQLAPKSIEKLANKQFVDRVRVIDNSSDEKPPHTVYDSCDDPSFETEGQTVDVRKWIEIEQNDPNHGESAKM